MSHREIIRFSKQRESGADSQLGAERNMHTVFVCLLRLCEFVCVAMVQVASLVSLCITLLRQGGCRAYRRPRENG